MDLQLLRVLLRTEQAMEHLGTIGPHFINRYKVQHPYPKSTESEQYLKTAALFLLQFRSRSRPA